MLDQLAVVHDRDLVAKMHSFFHVVGDQDDGCAEPFLDRQQILLRLVADHRIEGSERLVHEQHVRLGGECTRNADTLLLAARKFVRISGAVNGRLKLE